MSSSGAGPAASHASRGAVRVGVIGAGLAGLSAARALIANGAHVTVFEKSRAPGGRAATRRHDSYQFDHGAQYFTQRDPRIAEQLRDWMNRGIIAPWNGKFAARDGGAWRATSDNETRWVAVPGMRALGVDLAQTLDVRYNTTVRTLVRAENTWYVCGDDDVSLGEFDIVLVTAPAPQTHALLAPHTPAFATALSHVSLHPCIATMVVLERRPSVPWDAAFVNDDPTLSWVARNASKPGRDAPETWVLHATPAWSAAHLERDAASLVPEMLEAFSRVIGESIPALHAAGHRWRYAIAAHRAGQVGEEALYDAALALAAAGDWCVGGRVEGALISGAAAAALIVRSSHR